MIKYSWKLLVNNEFSFSMHNQYKISYEPWPWLALVEVVCVIKMHISFYLWQNVLLPSSGPASAAWGQQTCKLPAHIHLNQSRFLQKHWPRDALPMKASINFEPATGTIREWSQSCVGSQNVMCYVRILIPLQWVSSIVMESKVKETVIQTILNTLFLMVKY